MSIQLEGKLIIHASASGFGPHFVYRQIDPDGPLYLTELSPQEYLELSRTRAEERRRIRGEGELRIGDRVAVELPIDFEEIDVASIQVKDKTAQCAMMGDPAGLLWPAGKPKLREGMRVFRIPQAN